MIFGKTKLEFKVGIFVFIGIALLSFFILSIGKFRTWKRGYNATFVFNFVNGIKVGAPIRFAGVDVGEIKKINFEYLPQENVAKVHLHSWIRKGVDIPQDSTVWVNTLGLLGEKYVEIIPGKDYVHPVQPDQQLVGVDPVPMHEIFRMAKGIVEGIANKNGTVGKLLNDPTVYDNIEEFTDEIKRNPWKLFFKGKEVPKEKKK